LSDRKQFRQEVRVWLADNCPVSMRTDMPGNEIVWGGRRQEWFHPDAKLWMERMAEKGVTPEELERAKTYLTGAYPLRFDGNGQIASIMVGMQMDDLPIDYIATRNDKVNAVTLEEANRVARELLDPDNLHFVVVGRPQGLEAGN